MPRTPHDENGSVSRGNATPDDTIARLERALERETASSASLRASLDELRAKVEQLEAAFAARLAEAANRSAAAEHVVADQQARLVALGNGREESMRALAYARAELNRVTAERDELKVQLARIDGMQSSTIALVEDESEQEEPAIRPALPSIEELMSSLSSIEEAGRLPRSHLEARFAADADDAASIEMLAPEIVFPEEYAPAAAALQEPVRHARTSRVLVLLDDAQPVKYPLYKDLMTIGRAEDADIRIQEDFVSRVHARVLSTAAGVVIEDAESKNGIKVNSDRTARHALRHGDVISVGRVQLTFLDVETADV